MKKFLYLKKLIAPILVVVLVTASFGNAYALTNQQKLQQAQAAAAAAQAAADQKAKEAAAVQAQISVVNTQIDESQTALNQTVGQISDAEKNIEELSAKIKTEEENLAKQKDKLNAIISNWYMEGDSGFIEVVMSSNNLSQLVDKQQYYDSIKQQISTTMEKINQMKAELNQKKSDQEAKKAELESLKTQQTTYKNSIESQKTQKTNMLNMTVAQQTAYLAQVEKLKKDIASISAAIYAERQKNKYNESIVYGSSSYPFSAIDEPDPWSFLTRECTSYAAWYWNVKLGKTWTNTRPGSGSAWNWPALASDQGYSVSSTPRVGAFITWQSSSLTSQWGHVAIVEKVNGDGTIDVSEYNWSKYAYTYRKNVTPGNYGGYSYIY